MSSLIAAGRSGNLASPFATEQGYLAMPVMNGLEASAGAQLERICSKRHFDPISS
jgi:hypothetical protein